MRLVPIVLAALLVPGLAAAQPAREAGRRSDSGSESLGAIRPVSLPECRRPGDRDWAPAFARCIGQGREVYVPAGLYEVAAPVVLRSGTRLRGAGKGLTTIRLADRANADVVQTEGAYGLFGTRSSGGARRWSISDLTIDGNRRGQTAIGPAVDAVNCLAIYGDNWDLRDVLLTQCRGHGIRSEWFDGGAVGGMEASLLNVTIDVAGRHGWWFKGPHDSNAVKLIVIDAGQEMDDLYDGLRIEGAANGRFVDFHGWHRSVATNRVRYQLYSSGSNQIIASHIEGGRSQLYHAGQFDQVIGSFVYAPFGPPGSALVTFAGNSNTHVGNQYQSFAGHPTYGIRLGTKDRSVVYNRVVEGQFQDFDAAGAVQFVGDGGSNRISGYGFSRPGGTTTFDGRIHDTTEIDYKQGGTPIEIASWRLKSTPPAATSDACNPGQMTFDDEALYVCTPARSWKRAPLAR